jgi:hypothetical protein
MFGRIKPGSPAHHLAALGAMASRRAARTQQLGRAEFCVSRRQGAILSLAIDRWNKQGSLEWVRDDKVPALVAGG